MENVADKPEHAELKAKLRAEMEASLRRDHDPRMAGEGDKFDAHPDLGDKRHGYDAWLKNQ